MKNVIAIGLAAVFGFISAIVAVCPAFGIIDFWTATIIAVVLFFGSISSILGVMKFLELKELYSDIKNVPSKFQSVVSYIRRTKKD